MVSGFLISPKDHDRIFSGLAMEIRIRSKLSVGACVLNRFITSWFKASLLSPVGRMRREALINILAPPVRRPSATRATAVSAAAPAQPGIAVWRAIGTIPVGPDGPAPARG
jgi:hypothetical protein